MFEKMILSIIFATLTIKPFKFPRKKDKEENLIRKVLAEIEQSGRPASKDNYDVNLKLSTNKATFQENFLSNISNLSL